VAVDHLERSGTKRRVEAGVVAVLRPHEPLEPLAWPVASETMKVHCDHLVDRLQLAIGLWMER
jgi:hypothetical protein